MSSAQSAVNVQWCTRCGASHPPVDACFQLKPTGPERAGWRVMVEAPDGREVYSITMAPIGSRWRARVITMPNKPWPVPGGQVPLAFVGTSPEQVEQRAIEYVQEVCERHAFNLVAERAGRPHGGDAKTKEVPVGPRRRSRSVPVRWGPGRPTFEGVTGDLSEGGVFILTRQPLDIGTPLQLQLELAGGSITVRGVVKWVRERVEGGRPQGMGIRLTDPPAMYLHQVRRMA